MPDILEYKCPNCAAPMVFNPAVRKMKCGSCATEMEMEAFQAYDAALKANANQAQSTFDTYERTSGSGDWQAGERVSGHVCQSCGGELMTDGTTVATECPYCGNAAIVPEQVTDTLRPDFVIPFKMDKAAAKGALKKLYKRKVLLPKFFKEDNRLDKITGMYVPFWLYDCDTTSEADYDASRSHSWTSGNTRYTKTDHYLITRAGALRFDKIPADGSQKMDDTAMEAIEPYDYGEMTPFSMAYLSGYLADKYDVDSEAQKPRVDQRIRASVDQALRSTALGYSALTQRQLNVNIQNGQIHYALFPVWMLNTKWGKKVYTFAMNGQTGKVVGDLPIAWKKAAIIGAALFAGAAALLLTFGLLTAPQQEALDTIKIMGIAGSVIAGLSYISCLPFWKKRKGKSKFTMSASNQGGDNQ